MVSCVACTTGAALETRQHFMTLRQPGLACLMQQHTSTLSPRLVLVITRVAMTDHAHLRYCQNSWLPSFHLMQHNLGYPSPHIPCTITRLPSLVHSTWPSPPPPCSPTAVLQALLADAAVKEMLATDLPRMAFALRCRLTTYPEGVTSLWVMLALKHQAASQGDVAAVK